MAPGSARFQVWEKVTHAIAAIDPAEPDSAVLSNLLYVIFELDVPFEPGAVPAYWADLRGLFPRDQGP